MTSFWRIFWLEWLAAWRTRTLPLLAAASVAWMFAAPHLFRGDGTAEGARQLAVHYSLGGVALLTAIAVLASATGAIARERAAKRLQLTLVRPVRLWTVALAKTLALTAVGAVVLALAAGVEACRRDLARPCCHVLRPVLPSPESEAEAMYAAYMADPETPAEVKKAKKSVILRLLTQRAQDHYQTVVTNAAVAWDFARAPAAGMAARLKFSTMYDMRADVRGTVRFGAFSGALTNITKATATIPLRPCAAAAAASPSTNGCAALSFENRGTANLMLRPRRDVELLVPADGFAGNLLRAYLELVALLALLTAFGVFLGACLSRPVALFTAVVTLLVGEISPSVIEQYPDPMENDALDRIGLAITRASAAATHPFSALDPLARLAADECVEPREVAATLAADGALLPVALALLAALAMPRKEEA